MPIKFHGPNRMAAQQPTRVDPGSENLVKHKPTWGMGPSGMPGSFDYDASPKNSAFRRGTPEPNAYEQRGLYWTGSRVAQGRPAAEIAQGMRLAEGESVRRIAETAIKDKAQGIHTKNVASRIRQADEALALKGRGLDLQERGVDFTQERGRSDMALRESALDFTKERGRSDMKTNEARTGQAGRGLDLRTRAVDSTIERGAKADGVSKQRMELEIEKYELSKDRLLDSDAQAGQAAAAKRLGSGNADKYTDESWKKFAANGDMSVLQGKNSTEGLEGAYLDRYARLTGTNADNLVVSGDYTAEASRFLDYVEELSRDPRMNTATPDEVSEMAVRLMGGGSLDTLVGSGGGRAAAPAGGGKGRGVRLGGSEKPPMEGAVRNAEGQWFIGDEKSGYQLVEKIE